MSLELKKPPNKKAVAFTGIGMLLLLPAIGSSFRNNSEQSAQPPAEPAAETQQVKGDTTAKAPTIETKTVTETESIPYNKTTQNDPTLASGKTALITAGVDGVKTVTYQVTYTDSQETSRTKTGEQVTKQPADQVTRIGTKVVSESPTPIRTTTPASNCDPNYTGACVPIASDVDCAGGSGNGPAYVQGPITVVGIDIYHLDSDGDGIGCE